MASKKKNLKQATKDVLKDNEEVQYVLSGAYETKSLGTDTVKNGILIATQERLVFYASRLTGYDSESFRYENISSIDSGKKMLGKTLTFYSSGNEVTVKWIQDEEYEDFINYVESKIGKQESSTSALKDDSLDQLKKLKELLDLGAITPEEYDQKKEKLLDL
ncbi:PH domain-containing protein [Salinicoccus roseus]|uniref:PH domain-containing protein n=1 Tax=Salinicoccus roseus TaxID=45670 RepID=A0A0C2H7U3_9STAP|nr:PH domain-containing protein [Salinicoccus roseus]KIH69900.1 hypothetical protein SN16_10250 [Salinicoccus roseus]MDB0581185.1 PH domain-containing protein [Salinicoccus roseus]